MNTLQKAMIIVGGIATCAATTAAVASSAYDDIRQECIDATNEGRELWESTDKASDETSERKIREMNEKIRATCGKLFTTSEVYWQSVGVVRELGRTQDKILMERLQRANPKGKNGQQNTSTGIVMQNGLK